MTRSWFVRPEDWISKILKTEIFWFDEKKHTIWILIWRIKKHFYTYLWEPIVKDNKVPELPFHCLTEAIKANSDFDNMFHNFCSAFNWILSLRWGLSCGKEDVKKAAGAEECGPGRRTIPWRKKIYDLTEKIIQSLIILIFDLKKKKITYLGDGYCSYQGYQKVQWPPIDPYFPAQPQLPEEGDDYDLRPLHWDLQLMKKNRQENQKNIFCQNLRYVNVIWHSWPKNLKKSMPKNNSWNEIMN